MIEKLAYYMLVKIAKEDSESHPYLAGIAGAAVGAGAGAAGMKHRLKGQTAEVAKQRADVADRRAKLETAEAAVAQREAAAAEREAAELASAPKTRIGKGLASAGRKAGQGADKAVSFAGRLKENAGVAAKAVGKSLRDIASKVRR